MSVPATAAQKGRDIGTSWGSCHNSVWRKADWGRMGGVTPEGTKPAGMHDKSKRPVGMKTSTEQTLQRKAREYLFSNIFQWTDGWVYWKPTELSCLEEWSGNHTYHHSIRDPHSSARRQICGIWQMPFRITYGHAHFCKHEVSPTYEVKTCIHDPQTDSEI